MISMFFVLYLQTVLGLIDVELTYPKNQEIPSSDEDIHAIFIHTFEPPAPSAPQPTSRPSSSTQHGSTSRGPSTDGSSAPWNNPINPKPGGNGSGGRVHTPLFGEDANSKQARQEEMEREERIRRLEELDRAYEEFKIKHAELIVKLEADSSVELLDKEAPVSYKNNMFEISFGMLRDARIEWITNRYQDYFQNSWKYTGPYKAQRDELATFGLQALQAGIVTHSRETRAEKHKPSANILHQKAKDLLDLSQTILDILVGASPLGLVQDAYEAMTKKSFLWGHELSDFEHGMAIAGFVTFGIASKIKPLVRAFEALPRIKPKHDITFLYQKALGEIKETLGFFKKNPEIMSSGFNEKAFKEFSDAFLKGAKRHVLTEDTVVYRYYAKGGESKGFWLTRHKVDNPHEMLSLHHNKAVDVEKFIIPKGTEVLEGIVAPIKTEKFVRNGGANQIVINDLGVLQ